MYICIDRDRQIDRYCLCTCINKGRGIAIAIGTTIGVGMDIIASVYDGCMDTGRYIYMYVCMVMFVFSRYLLSLQRQKLCMY